MSIEQTIKEAAFGTFTGTTERLGGKIHSLKQIGGLAPHISRYLPRIFEGVRMTGADLPKDLGLGLMFGLEDMFSKYPEVHNELRGIHLGTRGMLKNSGGIYSMYSRTLGVNPVNMNPEHIANTIPSTLHRSKSPEHLARTLFTHEFGHAFNFSWAKSQGISISKTAEPTVELMRGSLMKKASKELIDPDLFANLGAQEISASVGSVINSQYAAFNPYEAFAEGFAAHHVFGDDLLGTTISHMNNEIKTSLPSVNRKSQVTSRETGRKVAQALRNSRRPH